MHIDKDFAWFCFAEVAIRDKMFVYDLDHQRIGWAEYNCECDCVFDRTFSFWLCMIFDHQQKYGIAGSLDVTRGEQNKHIINTRKSRGNNTKGGSYLTLMIYLLLLFLFSHWVSGCSICWCIRRVFDYLSYQCHDVCVIQPGRVMLLDFEHQLLFLIVVVWLCLKTRP